MLGKIKKYVREHTQYGKTRYLNYLYQYDLKQYVEHSCMNEQNKECVATKIRLLVHALEKGMSLPHCRPGFGKDKVLELLDLCKKYQSFDERKDDQIGQLVEGVVSAYVNYQVAQGGVVDFIPKEYLEKSDSMAGIISLPVKKSTNFEEIAKGRHSTRSYADRIVSDQVIRQVVQLAQTAPSACNRQATHIFACVNLEKIQQIMQMHGGTRGFDRPGVIFAITGDLNLYQNEYERNAVFIDGGIFLMNLLYSIDAYGLAACPVIWGSEPDNDAKLADILGIPNSHKIISLVTAGHYAGESYIAAKSEKRNVKSIMHIVK